MSWRRNAEMRPKPKPWDGRRLSSASRVEVKRDGYRLTIYTSARGEIAVVGRKHWIDLRSKLARDGKWCALFDSMPPRSIVDGELVCADGSPATEVPNRLAVDPSGLHYVPFAVPRWNDREVTDFEESDVIVKDIADALEEDRRLIEPVAVHSRHLTETLDDLLRQVREQWIEGFVIKEALYDRWWKVKATETVDLVVFGTVPGIGKHTGKLGSLICGVIEDGRRKIVARVGKGCDDQWRNLDEDSVIGRVVEVSHEGLQSKGRLKFSSFVRWRDDKPIEDCKL